MLAEISLTSWYPPPKTLTLESKDVHVWCASLNPTEARARHLWQHLTEDERVRAERFHFQKHRDHFVIARGLLRRILSRYLDTKPSQLRFSYNQHGKPALTRPCVADTLNFNLSHSHELVLYAITRHREIGVDLEYLRPLPNLIEIADRFFAAGEVARLRALPTNLKQRAFFNCWTRKEAYIKAKGGGLSIPLNLFEVSLTPGEPARLLKTAWEVDESHRWSLRELNPGCGYVAALAVEGHDWQSRCWRWMTEER